MLGEIRIDTSAGLAKSIECLRQINQALPVLHGPGSISRDATAISSQGITETGLVFKSWTQSYSEDEADKWIREIPQLKIIDLQVGLFG